MNKPMSNEELLAALKGFETPTELPAPELVQQAPAPSSIPDYDAELEQARKDRDNQSMWANLAKAASQFGGAYAGATKPIDTSVHDNIVKDADNYVDDVKTKQAVRKEKLSEEKSVREADIQKQAIDPNSGISQASRERLVKAIPEIAKIKDFDKLSAAQLEKLGFKMSSSSGASPFALRPIKDPDGVTRLYNINTMTNEKTALGQAGFADQIRQNPYTDDLISISPSAPSQGMTRITSPSGSVNKPNFSGQPSDFNQRMDSQSHAPSEGMAIDLNKSAVPESFKIRETLNPKQRESVQKNSELFLKDTAEDRDFILAARNVKDMLKAGKDGRVDGDILRMFQNKFARASGEKGAMTEQDVSPFGGRGAFVDKVNRSISMGISGKLPDSDRQFLSRVADIMEQASSRSVKSKTAPYISNVQRDTGLDADKSFKLLGGDSASIPEQKLDSNKVQMIAPDGRKLMVPLEKVKEMESHGAKRV